MRLMVGVDNEAWLEGALERAFTREEMVLVAYLEGVIDEVLFEVEPGAPS